MQNRIQILLASILGLICIANAMEREKKILTSEEIIQTLLEHKKKKVDKDIKEYIARAQEQLKTDERRYRFYEHKYQSNKRRWPIYEVTGGRLSYMMSLNDIIQVTKEKFKTFYREGKIMSHTDFQQQNKEKWFKKDTRLTRIWGAEYLAKKFKEDKRTTIKVPDYIIVVDDLDKVKVRIGFNTCFPVIWSIENGEIYAETIAGEPVSKKGLEIVGYGYTDYSEPGNILQAKDGTLYVVDTEYKSFYDGNPQNYFFKGFKINKCNYFRERFMLVNHLSEDALSAIVEFSVITP